MVSRTPALVETVLAGMFSAATLSAVASAQGSPVGAPRATALLTLRVAPEASVGPGAGLTTSGGEVRLLLATTPENGVRIAPAQATGGAADPMLVSGLEGRSILWSNRQPTPVAFSGSAAIVDARLERAYDERRARAIHWPIQGWPDAVVPSLHPDAHADELSQDLRRLVEGWMGAQTRSVTPAVLAKYLAARVMSHARPDLEPMLVRDASSPGATLGIRSTGVAAFARTGAGSEFDMLRAYGAALRIAGIPARVVVGARVPGAGGASLHAWVEFCLYDERSGDVRWVAVDLAGQRWLASDPPSIADAWRRFGANDAALVPLLIGIPAASAKDTTLLTPWRVECDPPCVPLRVTAVVEAPDASPLVRR